MPRKEKIMAIYKKITEIIGKTPLLELTNYEEKHKINATILAKLEFGYN